MLRQKVERNSVEGADCDALERGEEKGRCQEWLSGDFPSDPVAKTLHSQGKGSIPGQGTRPHLLQPRVPMLKLKPSTQPNK